MTQLKNPAGQNSTTAASGDAARHVTLAINGMHCANCVGRVEHNLLRVQGVRRAAVNLIYERAEIDYDPILTSPTELIAAVSKAGYKATYWQGIGSQMKRERIERIRVLVCLMLALPLLLNMLAEVFGWGAMPLSPFAALTLATIVQFWGGAPFYRGAVAALRQRTANMDVLVALGSSIAYADSVWRVAQNGMPNFESGALIIAFVLLGRAIEGFVRRKV